MKFGTRWEHWPRFVQPRLVSEAWPRRIYHSESRFFDTFSADFFFNKCQSTPLIAVTTSNQCCLGCGNDLFQSTYGGLCPDCAVRSALGDPCAEDSPSVGQAGTHSISTNLNADA